VVRVRWGTSRGCGGVGGRSGGPRLANGLAVVDDGGDTFVGMVLVAVVVVASRM
jgi:hypothetical protein